jgi:hypothetical protein
LNGAATGDGHIFLNWIGDTARIGTWGATAAAIDTDMTRTTNDFFVVHTLVFFVILLFVQVIVVTVHFHIIVHIVLVAHVGAVDDLVAVVASEQKSHRLLKERE